MVLVRPVLRFLRSSAFPGKAGGIAILSALVVGGAHAAASPAATPRAAAERFDSLMQVAAEGGDGAAGAREAARALTTGSARRLFPLLAETHARVAPFLDTAATRDTILDEAAAGPRAALKVRADVVFRRPFLGLDRMTSVQAIHLVNVGAGKRAGADWRLDDFEELSGDDAPLVVRTGAVAPPDSGAGTESAAWLPVSPRAPSLADRSRVTRLRVRVSARGGDALPAPPQTPGQRIVAGEPPPSPSSSYDLEIVRVGFIDSLSLPPWDDTLAVYRESTEDLDLTDKMLRTRAARLKQGSPHDVETARRIWRFVAEGFDYRLGATLFADSREALRSMKGDCSEAAVLTAALLRAAGIPSRVMMGYATLGRGVWIGHAWTEAHLGGGWVGMDAALRAFPAGADRVALLALSGATPMKAAATNLMTRTLGDLTIDITGAWADGDSIPLVEHPDAADEAAWFWDSVLEGMGE